jgi:hypothetical protein
VRGVGEESELVGGVREEGVRTGSQGFFSINSIICESWPMVVCSGGTDECPPFPDTVILTSKYPFSAVPGNANVAPYRFLTSLPPSSMINSILSFPYLS